MYFAQLIAVSNPHQVADDSPAEAQPVTDFRERNDQTFPGRRHCLARRCGMERGFQCRQVGLELCEQRRDRRSDMLGSDYVKAWQAARVE